MVDLIKKIMVEKKAGLEESVELQHSCLQEILNDNSFSNEEKLHFKRELDSTLKQYIACCKELQAHELEKSRYYTDLSGMEYYNN